MFQSFDETADPSRGPARLAALRREMAARGLAGFLVPRADAHQGEYVAPRDARLAWLTGFTGSAGFCAVLGDRAGVFVDSRYRVQVKAQVAAEFTPVDWPETGLAEWLRANGASGRLGYDPWLHTMAQIEALETALDGSGLLPEPVENLIDAIWEDRPAPPQGRATRYPEALAGRSAARKQADIAAALQATGERAAVLSDPASVCWLLNIRGSDIARIPVVQCFAVVHDDGGVDLVADAEKFAAIELPPGVRLVAPAGFDALLQGLTGPVRLDPGLTPRAVATLLEQAGVACSEGDDPCALPRATKTAAEIAATAEAHLRDGAAMCEFLCWLDAQRAGSLTEIDVVTALEGFRRATGALRDISFDTICGSGPNGAIVHYRVTHATNRRIRPGELLLVDSGGQYEDGTTDITRTIPIGDPATIGVAEKAAFTRVLRGMIAMSRLRWPAGLAGRDLDAIARAPLWQAGQDYGHGTGHGVGVYLSVHEGPQRLSRSSDVELLAGMILSNEPGFYLEGAFGIRIENLIAVEPAPALPGGTVADMLHFRTLTFAPIDRRLIQSEMLTPQERAWLDAYHGEVRERIGPRLGNAAQTWLDTACAPLGGGR